ncbi:MAG: hypothetical protein K2H18_00530 [Muribaculaceae bacterium]|nr:hypothetical protein [Muribaculaceae bacterium]
MKQIYTKLLLAIVTVVLGVASAHAEGPRSTVPAGGETIFATDENPLTRIVINCPSQEADYIAKVLEGGGNAILKKDGVQVQSLPPSQARITSTMTVINQVTYDLLDGGVYEPGTYTFSVSANTISYEKKQSASNLDAFEITFTILDANSMKVTPADGAIVSRADLREIVISYSDKVKLQITNTDDLKIIQKQSNVDKDIFSYGLSVRGQTITLTCKNINNPTNIHKTVGSANSNLTLTIPAGTFTVNGEPNVELTYSYVISAFTTKSITANPGPSDDSYTLSELRDISLEFSDEMQKVLNNSGCFAMREAACFYFIHYGRDIIK